MSDAMHVKVLLSVEVYRTAGQRTALAGRKMPLHNNEHQRSFEPSFGLSFVDTTQT